MSLARKIQNSATTRNLSVLIEKDELVIGGSPREKSDAKDYWRVESTNPSEPIRVKNELTYLFFPLKVHSFV
jgi:hypothetical protein